MSGTEKAERLLDSVFAELDIAALERVEGTTFRFVGGVPGWFLEYCPQASTSETFDLAGASLFIDNFLVDAEAHWAAEDGGKLNSGPWTEKDADSREWTLEATALNVSGRSVLLISEPALDYDSALLLLQTSREQSRDHQQLRKEIEKRQVLLHCIIHDLTNPLVGIKGGLQLLEARDLVSTEGQKLLEIALRQTDKMQWLIRSIMDHFAEDTRSLMPAVFSMEMAPDMAVVAEDVATKLSIQADMKNVQMDVGPIDESLDCRVVGDERRLERVLYNLAENALRYSPANSTVRIEVAPENGHVVAAVSDNGPGVSPQMRSRLFRQFSSGPDNPGQAGLGLYFCRITVEGWGGTIGYDESETGGARFWIRLPRPPEREGPVES